MRDNAEQINPGHRRLRRVFRIVGPIVAVAGVAGIVTAFANFAWAFGHFDRTPHLFWMGFVGVPLLFVGLVLCNAGYAGAVARYAAQEHAPVAADTLNYLAGETAPAVRAVADAVRGSLARQPRACPSCAAANDANARFCDSCGTQLSSTCPSCRTTNDSDAKFCDSCGHSLT
jgi:uncharacterized membrane protein